MSSKTQNVSKSRVCPVCSKVLRDKPTLKQHVASVHPKAVATVVPQNPGRGMGRQGRVESGCDSLAVVDVRFADTATGKVVYKLTLNPRSFLNTRLAVVASTWARWRPQKFRIGISTTCGAMVNGRLAVAWTPDVEVKLPTGARAISALTSWRVYREVGASQAVDLNLPTDSSRKWMTFVTDDDDDSAHGTLVVATIGQFQMAGMNQMTLSVRLDWSILFDGPELSIITSGPQPLPPTPQPTVARAVSGDGDTKWIGLERSEIDNLLDEIFVMRIVDAGDPTLILYKPDKPQTVPLIWTLPGPGAGLEVVTKNGGINLYLLFGMVDFGGYYAMRPFASVAEAKGYMARGYYVESSFLSVEDTDFVRSKRDIAMNDMDMVPKRLVTLEDGSVRVCAAN